MADQSILFSGPMIRALIAGRKTQTRRLAAPRWKAGDLVWVRETWCESDTPTGAAYCADAPMGSDQRGLGWRPSIHMFRRYSRLTLEIASTRQERLIAISEADALAEGSQEPSLVPIIGACWSEREAYAKLWEHIHGAGSWAANPLVWVTTFAVHKANIDELRRVMAKREAVA